MNGCTNDGVYSNPSPFGVCVTTPDHWSRRAACQPTRPPTVAKTPCNTTPRPRRKTFQRFVWSYHGRAMNPRSKQIPFWRCSCIIQLDLRVVWKSPSPPLASNGLMEIEVSYTMALSRLKRLLERTTVSRDPSLIIPGLQKYNGRWNVGRELPP